MDESYVGTRNEAGKKAAQVENMTNKKKKNRTCDRFRLTQNCQRWARWQGNYVWKYTRLHSTTTVIESRKMMSVGLKQRREKMVTHRVNPDGHYYFCSRHTLFGHFVFFLYVWKIVQIWVINIVRLSVFLDSNKLTWIRKNIGNIAKRAFQNVETLILDADCGAAFFSHQWDESEKKQIQIFLQNTEIWNKFSEWTHIEWFSLQRCDKRTWPAYTDHNRITFLNRNSAEPVENMLETEW